MLSKLMTIIVMVTMTVGIAYAADSKDIKVIDEIFEVDAHELFTVDIDVDVADLVVTRSAHRKECRVFLTYETDRFSPDISFTKNRLDVNIDCEKLFCNKDDDDGQSHGCSNNSTIVEVRIELPYGPDTSLDVYIKAGKTDFKVGDLSLNDFSLRCLAGKTVVDFDRPNRIEIDELNIHCSVGETELKHLGNARFKHADINGGVGEMNIDFTGDLIAKSYAKIDLDIGETDILVPDNTGTKIRVSRFLFFSNADSPSGFSKKGKTWYSDNYDDFDTRLSLNVSAGIGEVDIRTE
ncbi:LiaF domain-containing protein [Candidatus Latescibacterota bacterium]